MVSHFLECLEWSGPNTHAGALGGFDSLPPNFGTSEADIFAVLVPPQAQPGARSWSLSVIILDEELTHWG